MNIFLYSDNELKELDENGYSLYLVAKQRNSSDDWYQAGDKYDKIYIGIWGDYLFSGIKFGTREFVQSGLSGFLTYLEQTQEMIFDISLLQNKRRLIVSCEFYLKAIELNSSHYFANLQLATALTAALQIASSCVYWKRCIQLNKSDTLRALAADSMCPLYRGIATKIVIMFLDGNQSKMQNTLAQLQSDKSFAEQMREARTLLESSPYIKSRIFDSHNDLLLNESIPTEAKSPEQSDTLSTSPPPKDSLERVSDWIPDWIISFFVLLLMFAIGFPMYMVLSYFGINPSSNLLLNIIFVLIAMFLSIMILGILFDVFFHIRDKIISGKSPREDAHSIRKKN